MEIQAQSYLMTPQGMLEISCSNDTVLSVYFVDSHIDHNNGQRQSSPYKENAISQEAKRQLQAYIDGTLSQFDLPLGAKGTAFQRSVWQALCDIPYGETRSYGDIATAIGNPKAVRAVGTANSKNPISIIVPCHRVIGSNGKLTGYAGGLNRKEWLLRLEDRTQAL